jgi:hypothetical protein
MTTFYHASRRLMEETAQTTLQQPKLKPPKQPYASFLKGFVNLHPNRPQSLHNFVSEWLKSVGGRERRCRSNSYLRHSDNYPIPRNLTRSAPVMYHTQDADGVTASSVSLSPQVTGLDMPSPTPSRSSGKSLIEDPLYRLRNLDANNIQMLPLRAQCPEQIADLVNYVRKDRDSPGPSLDEVRNDAILNGLWTGAAETQVENCFNAGIFPTPGNGDILERFDKQPMNKHNVPSTPGLNIRLSTPVPDMLYGY